MLTQFLKLNEKSNTVNDWKFSKFVKKYFKKNLMYYFQNYAGTLLEPGPYGALGFRSRMKERSVLMATIVSAIQLK